MRDYKIKFRIIDTQSSCWAGCCVPCINVSLVVVHVLCGVVQLTRAVTQPLSMEAGPSSSGSLKSCTITAGDKLMSSKSLRFGLLVNSRLHRSGWA